MVRVMKKLLLFSILMLLPISSYALECDYTEKARLKKLASNLNTSYIPIEVDNTVSFNVTISNIYPGLLIVDASSGIQYTYDESREKPSEITITNLKPDRTYRYEVYSTNEECNDSSLNIYYVTLPAYNSFYKDPLCEGISDYKLCNKWYKTNITYDDFVKEVTEYKKNLEKTENIETSQESGINPIIDFILQYYYVFIILFISAVSYVIYVRRKRDSFGF